MTEKELLELSSLFWDSMEKADEEDMQIKIVTLYISVLHVT